MIFVIKRGEIGWFRARVVVDQEGNEMWSWLVMVVVKRRWGSSGGGGAWLLGFGDGDDEDNIERVKVVFVYVCVWCETRKNHKDDFCSLLFLLWENCKYFFLNFDFF